MTSEPRRPRTIETSDSRDRLHTKMAEIYNIYMDMKEKPDVKELAKRMIVPEVNRIHHERLKPMLPAKFDTWVTSMKAIGLAIPVIGQAIGYHDLYKGGKREKEYNRISSSSLYYLLKLRGRFAYAVT